MKTFNITISGHDISIYYSNKISHLLTLDEETYQINQAILDGYHDGEIFVESIKAICSWKII